MPRPARSAALALALAALAALAGCTVPLAPSPSPTSTSAPTRAPKALTCADLVTSADLRAAVGGSAKAMDPVGFQLGFAVDVAQATAVGAAGGLQCAWQGPAENGFTPTLTAQLLPDPDSQWTKMLFGDAPSTTTETFGSHTVTAGTGDPGYGATARVGGVWVFLMRTYSPTEGPDAGFLERLRPAFTSILDAAQAEGWRLGPPASTAAADACDQVLSTDRLAALLGGTARYDTASVPADDQGIDEVAIARVGDLRCFGRGGLGAADFAVARGGARRIATLERGLATDIGTYAPITLEGAASGDWAIAYPCTGRPGPCGVIFTHQGDAYQVVDAPDPKAVAEAILAQNP